MKKVSGVIVAAAISLSRVETASTASSAQARIDWDNLSFQFIDLSGGANIPKLNWTLKTG